LFQIKTVDKYFISESIDCKSKSTDSYITHATLLQYEVFKFLLD